MGRSPLLLIAWRSAGRRGAAAAAEARHHRAARADVEHVRVEVDDPCGVRKAEGQCMAAAGAGRRGGGTGSVLRQRAGTPPRHLEAARDPSVSARGGQVARCFPGDRQGSASTSRQAPFMYSSGFILQESLKAS